MWRRSCKLRPLVGLFFIAIVFVIWALQPSSDAPGEPVVTQTPESRNIVPQANERDRRRPIRRLSKTLPNNYGSAPATHDTKRVFTTQGVSDNDDQGPSTGPVGGSPLDYEIPEPFVPIPNPIIRDEENPNWDGGDRSTDGSLVVPRVRIDIVKNNIRRYYNKLPGNKKLPEKIVASEVLPPSILKALNMPEGTLITMMGDHDAQDIRGWEQAINMPENERANIGVMFLKPSGEEMRRYLFTFPIDGEPYAPASPHVPPGGQ